MVLLGAAAWAVAAAWPSAEADARAGAVLATAAGVGGLLVKSLALRRGVSGALAWAMGLFAARVALWMVAAAWLRAHGGNVAAFTAGFCAVFGLGLFLEVSFLLSASRAQPRGAG